MKIICFDTETSTLYSNKGNNNFFHIIQLSWVTYDTNTKVSIDNDYILKIPTKITNSNIHGITSEMSNKGYLFSDIISIFMDDVNQSDLLVGHNLQYDLSALELELHRLELYDDIDTLFEKEFFDTMLHGVGIMSQKYPKLQELYHYLFNKNFDNAHNALFDVKATLRVYLKLIEYYDS